MNTRIFTLLTCMALILALTGCNVARPLQCSDLAPDAITTGFPYSGSIDDVRSYVKSSFGIEDTAIKSDSYPEGGDSITWRSGRLMLSAFIHDTTRNTIIRWDYARPTLKDVFRCFGNPTYYQAATWWSADTMLTRFALWYPEKGLVAAVNAYGDFFPEGVVSDTLELSNMTIVVPGSRDKMVEDVYSNTMTPSRLENAKHSLKPWPGTLAQVVVDRRSPYDTP